MKTKKAKKQKCNSETVAVIPSNYEIYKKTKCPYFKNKN